MKSSEVRRKREEAGRAGGMPAAPAGTQEKVALDFRLPRGLNARLVEEISRRKGEPAWLRQRRLEAWRIFRRLPLPRWGPDLSALRLRRLSYYVEPKLSLRRRWEDLPAAVRRTFERLGVPQAERRYFAGAGAQLESLTAYHRLKRRWRREGVVFEDFDTAVKRYPALVRRYFMTECVRPQEHKFAALHGAVFSGGTFIYVPPRKRVVLPLQAYFRMFAPETGQFEHTLIIVDEGAEVSYLEACSAPRYNKANLHAGCVEIFVKRGARMRYISVENWSANTYNLNTKRALVDAGARLEFINGNFGAGVTMLYPCVVLRGPGAEARVLGVAFAGPGQRQDTGAKVYHYAPRTAATVFSRSVAGGDGSATYRSHIYAGAGAASSRTAVSCEALLLSRRARASAFPSFDLRASGVEVAHEAKVGRLSENQVFYLRSRGFSEAQAVEMLVLGFFAPLLRRLPWEYAVEFRRLLNLELAHKAA